MKSENIYDAIVIGGGFYGSLISLFLKKKFKNVLLIEKNDNLLLKASYNNQARIHNGYHYPRSFMTALRSHANYARFIFDFDKAVFDKHKMIYAIASNNSKVTANQFVKFCKSIGAPIIPAPEQIKKLFDTRLIEEVFIVEEAVFNAKNLRSILKNKLSKEKVKVLYKTTVHRVVKNNDYIDVFLNKNNKLTGNIVINCSYSGINEILENSQIKKLPLKHEITEMPLIKMPLTLKNMSFTIMDGPFFSVMPFPDKKLHTLHHVRYTPHDSTINNPSSLKFKKSRFIFMIKDATRYIPLLKHAVYKDSIVEIKTVLTSNELNDGRPILLKKDHGIKNFHVILGAKLDNIYDVIKQLEKII